MFTPQQIDQICFDRVAFGGYDMQSVDEFLEPLTEDYVTLYKENALLKSKMKVLVAKLEEKGIDLIVLAGFLAILSADFTRKYERRIINVHPSLIPSFCGKGYYGLRVHEAALAYGVKVTGATVHFVNEIPDGGEIILQKAVYIEDGDTPEVLQRRVMEEAEWQILPAAVEKVSAAMAQ